MAAGLGFKTFTTGEVLTAADTNGYLMQGVLVFASSAARAAAITSPQEGQYSYLKDTNSTEYYDGAAWIAAPIGDITGVTAGTGISGGGTSGTVTVTNSMATEIAAKGDLIVGTGAATFDNLAAGTNGQTLVADSTASTGLKWATASSGALTLITRNSFSAVASVAIDSIFSSTYYSYMVVIENIYGATGTDDLHLQMRYGSTTQAANYQGACATMGISSVTLTSPQAGTTSEFTLGANVGTSTYPNAYTLYFNRVGQSSQNPRFHGTGINADTGTSFWIGGYTTLSQTYTGILLKSSSSNITGVVSVYGLAAA